MSLAIVHVLQRLRKQAFYMYIRSSLCDDRCDAAYRFYTQISHIQIQI